MPLYADLNSTQEEPIKFFLNYPNGGRNILLIKFKKLKEYDGYYDAEKNKSFVKVDKRIDEDVVITSYEELTFDDFIRNEFDYEIEKAKSLITKFYKNHISKDENEGAYQKLLSAFVSNYDRVKNFPSYPEAELLPFALMDVVKYALDLYRYHYNIHLERRVNEIIKKEEKVTGNTGFKLRIEYRGRISEFNEKLISSLLIDSKTTSAQWRKFFNGNFVIPRINWIGIIPHSHLWYFIIELEKSETIIEFPKQQWKNLENIFTLNGKNLPKSFYKDCGYLNEADQKKIESAINSLKQ
jgi:hypothetical protein